MRAILLLLACILFTSCNPNERVLVFTKTEGYRHESIEKGVKTFKNFGDNKGFTVEHTEDANAFTRTKLSNYAAVVFLNTTGDVLNESQQEAFEDYIRQGGSFMGVHSATDTEYGWPWYGKLVGAYFKSHPNDPNLLQAGLLKTDNEHPSTDHLPEEYSRVDEWYNFKNLNPDLTHLIMLDESTYEGGENGENHPIAWYHVFEGGKAFYTGGGHTEAAYDEIGFQKHLEEALYWCMK